MNELMYVRYKDHVLFKNSDPNLMAPNIRECVGWVLKETDEALWLVTDRSVERLLYEKVKLQESGLVLLKTNIIEMKRFA